VTIVFFRLTHTRSIATTFTTKQSRPDEYYGRLEQWHGWEHFLLGDTDED